MRSRPSSTPFGSCIRRTSASSCDTRHFTRAPKRRLLDAARRQGKFEQTLAALFDRQQEWSSHDAPNVAHIWKIAADGGVDVKRAQRDAHDADVEALLLQETRDIYALKVDRTPTFFVNERPMLKYSPEHLRELVASEIERTQAPK